MGFEWLRRGRDIPGITLAESCGPESINVKTRGFFVDGYQAKWAFYIIFAFF
jgi:hypothetical protein